MMLASDANRGAANDWRMARAVARRGRAGARERCDFCAGGSARAERVRAGGVPRGTRATDRAERRTIRDSAAAGVVAADAARVVECRADGDATGAALLCRVRCLGRALRA